MAAEHLQSAIEKSENVNIYPDSSSLFGIRFEIDSLLTKEEEEAMFRQLKRLRKDSSRKLMINRIIRINLGLVIDVMKKMRLIGGQSMNSMDTEDIFQWGVTGLIKAVDGFDLKRKCRFSTLASNCIQKAITRAIDNTDATIRKPANICVKRRALYRETGETLPREKFLSLDICPDEGLILSEIVPDKRKTVEEQVESILLKEAVLRALNALPPRLKQMIILHYAKGLTLKEIGQKFGGLNKKSKHILSPPSFLVFLFNIQLLRSPVFLLYTSFDLEANFQLTNIS